VAIDRSLQPGDLLHCPHCRQWHALASDPAAQHEYVRGMLLFGCRKGRYFAGTIGGGARYATKRPAEKGGA
jgi:hypothetical protein